MTSSLAKPSPIRRLRELLQEQQEPFLLDVYLLERGYLKKSSNSEGSRSYFPGAYSSKNLKRFGRYGLKMKKERILHCLGVLRSLLNKLVSFNDDRKTSRCDTKVYDDVSVTVSEIEGRIHEVAELDQSCPGTTSTNETQSTLSINLPYRVTKDSILSASLWDSLEHSLIERRGFVGVEALRELHGSGSSSQYLKPNRVLQQTKQLLFDCVSEVVESYGKKGRSWHDHEFLGSEELGKIICKQLSSWGKLSGDETSISQLIDADISDSTGEWNFQPQIRNEIGMEIADAILEEIRSEIVADIIDLLTLSRY